MEKLSSKKFDANQIISDEQAHSLYGGKQYTTRMTSGPKTGHADSWNDANNNLRWDKGDTLIIFGMIASGGEDQPCPYTEEQLVMLGVAVTEAP